MKSIRLENGTEIPALGLGVYRNPPGDSTLRSALWALEAGYRHIDTAAIYRNEKDVGTSLVRSALPREELFITTKLWRDAASRQDVIDAFDRSREKLGLDYVDLYLVHAPTAPGTRRAVWEGMESLFDSRAVRAIGVSNFGVHHLEALLCTCRVRPMVNQLELSPYLQRRQLVSACRSRGIVLTAYSPLAKGFKMDDPMLLAVAEANGKTPAQVLIR